MRTILLPLSGTATDRRAVETGLAIAAPFAAHLTALLPRPEMAQVPVSGHYVSTFGFAELIEEARIEADSRESKTRAMIEAVGQARGVCFSADTDMPGPTIAFATPAGDDDAPVQRLAAVHDLIVHARFSTADNVPLSAPAALKNTLEFSGRPVLVVTDDLPSRFATVAIAWNGSVEGARAVTGAMSFLRRAERIVILTVATAKTSTDVGDRLRGYLRRHGLAPDVEPRLAEGTVGQELIEAAHEHRADLLVTGGYTNGRMRQSLFGGVTHRLLDHCRIPMLMAH